MRFLFFLFVCLFFRGGSEKTMEEKISELIFKVKNYCNWKKRYPQVGMVFFKLLTKREGRELNFYLQK